MFVNIKTKLMNLSLYYITIMLNSAIVIEKSTEQLAVVEVETEEDYKRRKKKIINKWGKARGRGWKLKEAM